MTKAIKKEIENKGIVRYETLFGIMTPIVDMSHQVRSIIIPTYRDLSFFELSSVLEPESVFLGFGSPNVYLGMPDDNGGFVKFDAKSIKRAESRLMNMRNLAQSGLLFKINDVTSEMLQSLRSAAKAEEGTKQWTCVHANARVLSKAGFNLGTNKHLTSFYFPMPLAREILRNGLYYNGKRVGVTPIRTVPSYLERFGLSVIKSQWFTVCRHGERYTAKKAKVISKTWKAVKTFWSKLPFAAKREKEPIEDKVTLLAESKEIGDTYPLQISYPSFGGVVLRWIWGPHSFFTITPRNNVINDYLTEVLTAYAAKKGSLFNTLKQKILFRPVVIRFIRHYLVRNTTKEFNVGEHELFNMLRTDTDGKPHKYNIVITGKQIIVMKLGIKYKFVDWVLSKHILSSGYSSDIRFAGEAWKTEDGVIHINNNSGTYAPSNEILTSFVAYFSALFPNVTFKHEQVY